MIALQRSLPVNLCFDSLAMLHKLFDMGSIIPLISFSSCIHRTFADEFVLNMVVETMDVLKVNITKKCFYFSSDVTAMVVDYYFCPLPCL